MANLNKVFGSVIVGGIASIVLPALGSIGLNKLNETYPAGDDNRYVYTIASYAVPLSILAMWVAIIFFAVKTMK